MSHRVDINKLTVHANGANTLMCVFKAPPLVVVGVAYLGIPWVVVESIEGFRIARSENTLRQFA